MKGKSKLLIKLDRLSLGCACLQLLACQLSLYAVKFRRVPLKTDGSHRLGEGYTSMWKAVANAKISLLDMLLVKLTLPEF